MGEKMTKYKLAKFRVAKLGPDLWQRGRREASVK